MWEMKLGIILLAIEIMGATTSTLSKAAMAKGMSNYIFTTYTHAIATFFLLPAALLWHRKTPPPSIGCSIILKLLLLSTINYGFFIFFFSGVRYSSPSLGSAMTNLSPAFTFIIAIIFRMEVFSLGAQSTMFKTIGAIVSIGGALIVTFYQGFPITFPSPTKSSSLLSTHRNSIKLGCWSSLAYYKYHISLTLLCCTDLDCKGIPFRGLDCISCFFETVMAAVVAFIAENDASVWTPNFGIEWTSILVGAIQVSLVNIVHTWACKVKGPLFVAMFKPLQMIIAAIMGVSFLGDVLHVGSLIGGVIIALGFYTVMKGKAEEEILQKGAQHEETCHNKLPLLLNGTMEEA